jgi:hypothetical protein
MELKNNTKEKILIVADRISGVNQHKWVKPGEIVDLEDRGARKDLFMTAAIKAGLTPIEEPAEEKVLKKKGKG